MAKQLSEGQREVRNERIRKMYRTGKYTVRGLASKIGLSKTRIHEIIAY